MGVMGIDAGDTLFGFGIVLHLEHIDHECLSVLAHVAQHDSLCLVEGGV